MNTLVTPDIRGAQVTGSLSRGYELFSSDQILETLASNNKLVRIESAHRPEKMEAFGARKANTGGLAGSTCGSEQLPAACAWGHIRAKRC